MPDDHRHQSVGRRRRHAGRADLAAIAQHRHPVGKAEHLIEPMRHINDAETAFAQTVQRIEKSPHIRLGQGCGRLVENQNFALRRQRARDRHDRFLGGGQRQRLAGRVDIAGHRIQRMPRGLIGGAPVDQPATGADSPRAIATFSATVIVSTSPRSWWMKLIGSRPAAGATGSPCRRISPPSGE